MMDVIGFLILGLLIGFTSGAMFGIKYVGWCLGKSFKDDPLMSAAFVGWMDRRAAKRRKQAPTSL